MSQVEVVDIIKILPENPLVKSEVSLIISR